MPDDPRTTAPDDPRATRRELAARYLRAAGFDIVCRRWHSPYGVLDLVARDAGTTVFVTVRTAIGSGSGDGLTAGSISRDDQQRIRRLALLWLTDHDGPRHRIRFDVLTIRSHTDREPTIEHHRGAF
ncbi:YraN family protein [Nocardia fusca]|uniref:YraN family protein n=1 Tax=Nocardia fusca TaxID=941183 RepID=UPI0007A73377|nr:YraN family protein [Nocardia fusca]